MENLKTLLKEINIKTFKITKTKKGEKIQQTEHRQLKTDIMNALLADFKEMGLALGMSKDGLVIEIPNDHLGAIPAELDLKLKSLDFDTSWAVESYEKEQAEKEIRKEKSNKDKKYAYSQAVKLREKEKK